MKPKILFVCGSLNQTTMMHQIARHFPDCWCSFTPFYADGLLDKLNRKGLLDFTILGGQHRRNTLRYLKEQGLQIDERGEAQSYDLVFTCTDLIVQYNLHGRRMILVQEGMMESEGLVYHLVRQLNLPRYLANTAATGLSDAYDVFCVASPGYRDLFIRKGVKPEKIHVTGIPNFDHAHAHLNNDFPYKNYVLVATSCTRETFKYDNRMQFIRDAVRIAAGRPMIFKLHPNENFSRTRREILTIAPDALIYEDGNTNFMVANCDVLITQYSSVVFIGLALGKEVYSYHNLDLLRQLMPLQNGGTSALRIAEIGKQVIRTPLDKLRSPLGFLPQRRPGRVLDAS